MIFKSLRVKVDFYTFGDFYTFKRGLKYRLTSILALPHR